MPVTHGPQSPGWDPIREQERARELAKLDAAVDAAEEVTAEDGDLAEAIWLDLQTATAGIGPVPPLRHGPQFVGWEPHREQDRTRRRHQIERTLEAAQVVADEDGDASAFVWQHFELTFQELEPFVIGHIEFFPP